MPNTAQEVYLEAVSTLSLTERLRLAAMILGELTKPHVCLLETSDSWSEEDQRDLAAFALSHAAVADRDSEDAA